MIVDAEIVENLHHLSGKAALRKAWSALHEQHDVVPGNFITNEFLNSAHSGSPFLDRSLQSRDCSMLILCRPVRLEVQCRCADLSRRSWAIYFLRLPRMPRTSARPIEEPTERAADFSAASATVCRCLPEERDRPVLVWLRPPKSGSVQPLPL